MLKVNERVSPSASDPVNAICAVGVSLSVLRIFVVVIVGASFTALTVIFTVSVTSTVPSLAVIVKLSDPFAFASGV